MDPQEFFTFLITVKYLMIFFYFDFFITDGWNINPQTLKLHQV